MIRAIRIVVLLLLVAVVLATGWVVGYVALLGALVLLALRLPRTTRALGPTLRCTHCDEDVALYGLFRCATCGAITEGIAWRCALCGAGPYSFVPCTRCGVAVPNPDWEAP